MGHTQSKSKRSERGHDARGVLVLARRCDGGLANDNAKDHRSAGRRQHRIADQARHHSHRRESRHRSHLRRLQAEGQGSDDLEIFSPRASSTRTARRARTSRSPSSFMVAPQPLYYIGAPNKAKVALRQPRSDAAAEHQWRASGAGRDRRAVYARLPGASRRHSIRARTSPRLTDTILTTGFTSLPPELARHPYSRCRHAAQRAVRAAGTRTSATTTTPAT